MKIEKLTLYHLRMPLVQPFATSFGVMETRDCILIEVWTDGLVGYGECVASDAPLYSYETIDTAWHILKDFIAPIAFATELPNADSYSVAVGHIRGHQMAKAGLEMVLWDLWGKRRGQSLAELLGGERKQVPVGVSIGIQVDTTQLLTTVENYLADGYQRVKLKIKPGRDVLETKAVREAYPDLKIQVDANSAYTLESAVALKPLDELDLLLIEQPLDENDLWDHHKLQATLETSICLDESITSLQTARQAIEMDATRVINIKQGRVGGIWAGLQIHDHCAANQIPVWCGGMLETGVGRAANLALASLPNFSLPGDISATDRYYALDITEQSFHLNPDSTIDVPSLPGLGVTINPEALERYTQSKITLMP